MTDTQTTIVVKSIAKICDPFISDVCGDGPIKKADVENAIIENKIVAKPTTSNHVGRIAFFVLNPPRDAIEIDVGVPVLGYCPSWIVTDGNHRLAAAIFSGARKIRASISGQIDVAERLFGVGCCDN